MPSILRSTTNTPNLLALAVLLAPSRMAPPASLSNVNDKLAATYPVVAYDQAPAIEECPTTDLSLWDRTCNILKEEEPSRVIEYKQLLSRVLIRGMPLTYIGHLLLY
jgi:hypothetical protein